MTNEPFFYAGHKAGDRGWEIGERATRNRICAELTEADARSICALMNAAFPLAYEYDIPTEQIAAIWRMIKDNT